MLRCLILVIAGALAAPAHDLVTTKLTWSAEISRILQRRCLGCHTGKATDILSLASYEQARPWAKAIRDEVLGRRMPPWGAVKGFRDLRDDVSLTQDEIMRIAEWVEGGAPEGNPAHLPPAAPGRAVVRRLPRGRFISQQRLRAKAEVLGIYPLETVAEAKLFARLPDGSVEPLLWLHEYSQEWQRTFVFEKPLNLPAGTVIVSEPQTRVSLLVRLPRPAQ